MANRKDSLSLAEMGAAGRGENSDISQLTGLSGPTRLGGDAIDPYDGVTLRQLKSASNAGGATMNGVQNNFIGAVEWFNGDRANLPAGYAAADGQVMLKTAEPELWAAVNSGFLRSTNQATWTADPLSRGMYAYDTAPDSFRLPDYNGVQSGSHQGIFLSGTAKGTGNINTDPKATQDRLPGKIFTQSAPPIRATVVPTYSSSASLFDAATGAFKLDPPSLTAVANPLANSTTNVTARGSTLTFDAGSYASTYGPGGWLVPNHAVGIWIIRVNGAFNAANTNFNILNGDAAQPANGTVVNGGVVVSRYQVNGVDFATGSQGVKVATGKKPAWNITLADNNGKTYPFQIGGERFAGGPVPLDGLHMTWKEAAAAGWIYWNGSVVGNTSGGADYDKEIMVSIYPDRMHVTGLTRHTPNGSGTVAISIIGYELYSITAMPPGKTRLRKPFCPVTVYGYTPSGGTAANAVGFSRVISSMNQWVVMSAGYPVAGTATGFFINDVIYFDD